MRRKFSEVGSTLISLAVYLLAFTIPLSIAGDNVAIAVGGLGLLFLLIGGGIVRVPDLKPIALFCVPEAVSVVASGNLRKAWKQSSLNHHLLPFVFVYDALSMKRVLLDRVLKFLSVSSFILAFSVVAEAFTHQNLKHFNWSRFHLFLEPVRAKGLFHQLTTGGLLFLLSFLFLGFAVDENKRFFRQSRFLKVVLPCLFFALILNQSRSYWIGSFVAIFLFLFFRYKRRAIFYAAAVAVLFSGLTFAFSPLRARLESIFNVKTNGSNTTRLIIWRSHFEAIKNDFTIKQKLLGAPVTGKDMCCKYVPESYEKILGRKPPYVDGLCDRKFYHCLSHNIYLKYLTDFGFAGLLGYVAFIVFLVVINVRGFFKFSDSIFAAFASMYAGFAAAGFFENNFTDAEVKICFMFILGINFYLLDKFRSGEAG
ncbi:O-antigen ligase family protein [Desulfurobacterium sp.]